jgi:hypothetical protein
MKNDIQVFVRSVYGNKLVYPANAEANAMADLLQVKSFNPQQIAKMKAMGFEFVVVPDPSVSI